MWYEDKMEYLSVIKINGFPSFVAMWLDHFIFSVVSRHRKSNVTCCHTVKYKNTLHRRNKSQGSTGWRWRQLTRTSASSRKQFLPLDFSAFVGGSPLQCWLLHLLHLGWTEALESDLGSCLLARGSREHEPEPLSLPLLTSLGHKADSSWTPSLCEDGRGAGLDKAGAFTRGLKEHMLQLVGLCSNPGFYFPNFG